VDFLVWLGGCSGGYTPMQLASASGCASTDHFAAPTVDVYILHYWPLVGVGNVLAVLQYYLHNLIHMILLKHYAE